MNIAITGATGFLGSHLVDKLVSEGHKVFAHARDEAKAKKLEGKATKIVVCDITDEIKISELVKDADIVIHTVSNFRTASGPPASYKSINYDGTVNTFNAAVKAGVKRFVHCSTIGVLGNIKECPADENTPFNPGDLYQETKLDAELYVREQVGKSKMEVVVIRPCSMYGPGDMRMLKMFKMLVKRTFLMIGPCVENFHAVYIDDIVDGFIKAMETQDIDGEVFIIGGNEYVPLREYISIAANAVGAPMPWLKFPYWLFYSAAVVIEAICVPLRIEPPLHRRRVRFYKNNRAFNISKAHEKLKFKANVDMESGMAMTVEWYRQNNYL